MQMNNFNWGMHLTQVQNRYVLEYISDFQSFAFYSKNGQILFEFKELKIYNLSQVHTPVNFITYSSFGVGIFGILIAIIQGFERKKLKQFMYSQAWHIFSVSNLSFGAAQSALKAYKESYGDKLDPEILEYLSKCDAHNINLFIEAIRQIHLSEPKFNLETITQWTMQGKIRKEQAQYFIQIMSPELPSLIFLIWNSSVLKIKQKLIKWIKPQYPKENTKNNSKPE